MKIKVSNTNVPSWQSVVVKSQIPDELKKLEEMSRNIWWAWNYEATELFKSLDPELWRQSERNPVVLLERLSYEKLQTLAADNYIIKRINNVYDKFKSYMNVEPDKTRPSVAYFCMEYGLTSVLKIYSGGLGILAGDYMKEASDSNVDMCGIGFLYRYGYFTQSLSMDGQQVANYEAQNFGSLPLERVNDEQGQPLVLDVPYLNYFVHANVWKVNVGRISLYLLDNSESRTRWLCILYIGSSAPLPRLFGAKYGNVVLRWNRYGKPRKIQPIHLYSQRQQTVRQSVCSIGTRLERTRNQSSSRD